LRRAGAADTVDQRGIGAGYRDLTMTDSSA
jgi:hypothetical protein